MNKISVFILIVVVNLSCKKEEVNYQNFDTRTVINGYIKDFNPKEHQDFLQVLNLDLITSNDYLIEINNSGEFHFSFQKLFPIEMNLRYGTKHMFLYLSPGDSINIMIDANEFHKNEPENEKWKIYKFNNYKLSGDYDIIANEIINFQPYFYDNLFPIFNDKTTKATYNFSSKVETIKESFEKVKQLLRDYHGRVNSSERFILLSENFIYYNYMQKLIIAISSAVNNDEINKIPSYLNMEAKEALNPQNKMYSIPYYVFLNRYKYRYSMVQEYANIRTLYKDDKTSYYSAILEIFSDDNNAIGHEILLTETLIELINEDERQYVNELFSQYIEEIPHEFLEYVTFLNENILEKNQKFLDENTSLTSTNSRLIDDIMIKYKGKLIYIDFWATWCKPCLIEMDYSKELIKSVDSTKVAFVFICLDSDKKEWQEVRDNLNLEGDHYFVDNAEIRKIRKTFEIGSIPHYSLINRNGIITLKNAPRPSEKEKLIGEIEKLLE